MDFLTFCEEVFENLNIYDEEKLKEIHEEMEIYEVGFNIACNKINEILEGVFLENENAVERYEKILFGNLQTHNDLFKRKENLCMFFGLNNTMFSKNNIEKQLLARDIKCDININEDALEVTLKNINYKGEKTELRYVKNIIEKIFPLNLTIKENASGLSWREWEEKDLMFFEIDNLNLSWKNL